MTGAATAVVPILYVRSADQSARFYRMFGFAEDRQGALDDSQWRYLRHGELTLLLAEVHPPLITVALPLVLYIYVDALEVVLERLAAGGASSEHIGYPDHAPGGEARVLDPDGNVVLVGQREAVTAEQRVAQTGPPARFELIQEAAEDAARRAYAPSRCQIGNVDGTPCPSAAEVKLADPWGDTTWGCVPHVEEALIIAKAAFIATDEEDGIGPFLQRRRAAASRQQRT
ncbi:VOC family protein [Pilimelia columellifera]|uniref:VOC domain-containing protein n=1 Tax=Pilimelia columellifera subsp. columellifera TaxID=706583 RepID=A0ABP6A9H3_9ACTN